MTDEMIVSLYWERDEGAIAATDKKYGKYLTKIAYNILNDDEDTKESLNDTYLAAWDSIPPNRPKILSSYLVKLIRRTSIDVFRKKNREKRKASQYSLSLSELSECLPANTPTPEEGLETKILANKINSFLYSQKKEVRTVFIGKYYFLDSVKDIAKYSGLSEAKVKTILYRTRISLKSFLEKEGYHL